MKLKLMDLKTGEQRWSEMDAGLFWWSEGNGSCDCNRALEFDSSVDEEMTGEYGENTCYGCMRFVAVDASGDFEGMQKQEILAAVNEEYSWKSSKGANY